jgi:hypothetical protein
MRAISMATRAELIEVTRSRYTSAPKLQKRRILDEFAAVTGYHRKHAMRLLRSGLAEKASKRSERRIYDDRVPWRGVGSGLRPQRSPAKPG